MQRAIHNQGRWLRDEEEFMRQLQEHLIRVTERQEGLLAAVSDRLSSLCAPTATRTETTNRSQIPMSEFCSGFPVQLAKPEKFSGDLGDCRAFLTQCE